MPLDPVSTLQKLVSLPSVNPMGCDLQGPIYRESRVTAYLQSLFEGLGLPWVRDTVEPERDNIVIRLDGDQPGLMVWEVHQDTVPVEGMTIDPFGGELRENRVWGRGACDIKGGMAAMLSAFTRLAEERPKNRPTVVLACTVNEEYGFTGAQALTHLWSKGPNSIIPRTPDVCLVSEPTLLDVVVAHRGIVRWRCHVHGRAAHSSQPDKGENAIYKMMGVVRAFQRYHQEITPTLPGHHLCGQPTLCVSTIAGGVSVNTVPGSCTVELDRRLVPGELPEVAYDAILKYVAEQNPGVTGIEHEPPYRAIQGLPDINNGPLAEALLGAVREVAPQASKIGVPYGTDASVISTTGVPTVVFGPGSIEQAHTADEWLAVDELQKASEAFYRFACRGW